LIDILSLACDLPGATMLAPLPGFVMYEMSARLRGLGFVGVPLTADFELDEASRCWRPSEEHRPAITYIAYPNNPTANLFDDAVIDAIVAAVGAAGRAWWCSTRPTSPSLRAARLAAGAWRAARPRAGDAHPQSKFGLAGVRLGYLVGPAALIAELDKVRPPYNVSVLNAEAALFALEHADEYARQAALLRAERERLLATLAALPGVQRVWPSEANMILIRVADAATTFAGMKQRGVLIKNVSALHPLLAHCLRLTVGTPEENARMIEALAAATA
jgi:histidinol-phosphate aminotransferase